MSGMSRIFERIYRYFLLAYPRECREDCGEEMVETLRARAAALGVSSPTGRKTEGRVALVLLRGTLAALRFWVRELWSVARGGTSLRWRPRRKTPMDDAGSKPRRNRHRLFDSLLQDIRFGLRTLRRRPLFTVIAVGTLGLGIGATTVIFSLVDGVLIQNLGYERPGELVRIWQTIPEWRDHEILNDAWDKVGLSWPQYLAFRDETKTFQDVAVHRYREMTLTGVGDPTRLWVGEASASLFSLLGVRPLLGRTFLPGEEGPGAEQLVVVSHSAWATRFGSDPGILGQTVALDNRSFEVIGVLPPGVRIHSTLFNLFNSSLDTGERSFWVPIGFDGRSMRENQNEQEAIGRLAPGATIEQARSEVETMLRRERSTTERSIRLTTPKNEVVRDHRSPLLLLVISSGILLVVACGNVATLLMSEAMGRGHEMATRVALGARRSRITRQLLTESVILGLGGSAVGVLLAFAGVHGLLAMGPPLPRLEEVTVHRGVLGLATLTGMVTGLLFGLAPAFLLGRRSVSSALGKGGRGIAGGGMRFQRGVVSLELACTMLLLVTGGLFANSLVRLLRTDPGFEMEQVATVRVELPWTRYREDEQAQAFYAEVMERMEAIPGVEKVGGVSGLPFPGRISGSPFTIDNGSSEPGTGVMARVRQVLPGYLEVMGIPLLAGREFTEGEVVAGERLMLINESMARRFPPGESPLGRIIHSGETPYQVVGVTGDIRERHLGAAPEPMVYLPAWARGSRAFSLVARTAGTPEALVPLLREAVWAVDPDVPLTQETTMAALVAGSTGTERYRVLIVTCFGILAMLIASVGVFGTTAVSVVRRAREMGIRMTLGAERGGLILTATLGTVRAGAVGIVLGTVGALAATRLLSAYLFGIEAWDPATYAGAAGLLGSISVLAAVIPARRATRIAPMEVLREE